MCIVLYVACHTVSGFPCCIQNSVWRDWVVRMTLLVQLATVFEEGGKEARQLTGKAYLRRECCLGITPELHFGIAALRIMASMKKICLGRWVVCKNLEDARHKTCVTHVDEALEAALAPFGSTGITLERLKTGNHAHCTPI